MDRGEHRGAEEEAGENKYIRFVGRDDMENFSATRALASRGTAQAQAGMEAWCGDDIDPFRLGRFDCARERRRTQFGDRVRVPA